MLFFIGVVLVHVPEPNPSLQNLVLNVVSVSHGVLVIVLARCPPDSNSKKLLSRSVSEAAVWSEGARGGNMPTDQEPSLTVKLLQLTLLSTYWGMQIWVTFISSWYQVRTHTHVHTLAAGHGGKKQKWALCYKTVIVLHFSVCLK